MIGTFIARLANGLASVDFRALIEPSRGPLAGPREACGIRHGTLRVACAYLILDTVTTAVTVRSEYTIAVACPPAGGAGVRHRRAVPTGQPFVIYGPPSDRH